jgi:choline dehydrogenase-like flavoprotein
VSIRALKDTGQPFTQVRADVCVVGAGLAGLMAAVRIARNRRLRVVVVESGLNHVDPRIAALDEIDNRSPNYGGMRRARGLGGTSRQWAGKLVPLSASDITARPWIDAPAWPLSLRELELYAIQIESLFGVDPESHEEAASSLHDPDGLLPRNDPELVVRWPKRPSAADHDVSHVLRSELASRENLTIWLGATATHFALDSERARAVKLEAKNHEGQRLVVDAREYLLAAGTLESTRLLLVTDREAGGVISRTTGVLGRHFNDHLGLDIATLRPLDAPRTNRAFADRWLLGSDRHLHLELRPELQREFRIGSAYADFSVSVPEDSALTQARLAIQAARERKPASALVHGLSALPDAATLLHTARWQAFDKLKYWPSNATVRMKLWIEQRPHSRNRITLVDREDSLGQKRLNVEFHRTDDEERAFRVMLERVRAFWARHFTQLCELEWAALLGDPAVRLVDRADEMAHPAGSTRMGHDPATSVVDPQLRVHAIPNLSVASASVFPSSGSANPTFTILQLALRAADAITARLS